jgi:hypothetical protein
MNTVNKFILYNKFEFFISQVNVKLRPYSKDLDSLMLVVLNSTLCSLFSAC